MTVAFNPDGSTHTINGQSFKSYVREVWEEEGIVDPDDFDPDDQAQIRRWVAEWEMGDE